MNLKNWLTEQNHEHISHDNYPLDQTIDLYETFLTALIVQHWQFSGTKQSCKFWRYYPNIYPGKPSKTTEFQPEGAAGVTVAADSMCYSLLRSWVQNVSKNL